MAVKVKPGVNRQLRHFRDHLQIPVNCEFVVRSELQLLQIALHFDFEIGSRLVGRLDYYKRKGDVFLPVSNLVPVDQSANDRKLLSEGPLRGRFLFHMRKAFVLLMLRVSRLARRVLTVDSWPWS